MTSYTATYSAEDNKLRLYASSRLDAETYATVKAAGFQWAPKQELFVAPAWSPSREDLLISLAGEIEPEQSSMAERAEAKAERLEALSDKRRMQATAFSRAADRLCERFAGGQPILSGHHSERSARRDRDKADNAQRKAIEADKAAGWWLYKASAAQHHANRKNAASVRARRIKTLLAELRDMQRTLNHASIALEFWSRVTDDALIRRAIGGDLKTGSLAPWGLWSEVDAGRMSPADARLAAIASFDARLASNHYSRWIAHILNRLSFERELLGEVAPFVGDITPVMLQEFTREHGADSPKGKHNADGTLTLSSDAPLPAHIGDGKSLTMTGDEWRALMAECGYEAAAKAAKKAAKKSATAPLLNVNVATLSGRCEYNRGKVNEYRVRPMTKAAFAAVSDDCRGTRISACGQFRFRICPDPDATGPYYSRGWVAAFLTDSKAHALPASAPAPVAVS